MYLGIGLVLAAVALALYDRILAYGLVADDTRTAITWDSVKTSVGAALRTWRGLLSGVVAGLAVGAFKVYNTQIVIYSADGVPDLAGGETFRISPNPPHTLANVAWKAGENWLVLFQLETVIQMLTLMILLGVVVTLFMYQLGGSTRFKGVLAVPGSVLGVLGVIGCCGSILLATIGSIAGVSLITLVGYSDLFFVLGVVFLSISILHLSDEGRTCEY